MTHLILARHGETAWHFENRYAGVSDVDLSPRGEEQARRLGEWTRRARIDCLWCSPLRRARRTASFIERTTPFRARVDNRLRELDFGIAEGRTLEELRTEDPRVVRSFLSRPVTNHMQNGEDPEAAAERALESLTNIARSNPGRRVLIVGHGTLFRLVLTRLLGIPLNDYRRAFPVVVNAGLSEVVMEDGHGALLSFNVPVAVLVDEARR